jgi:hypothetical protein
MTPTGWPANRSGSMRRVAERPRGSGGAMRTRVRLVLRDYGDGA